MTYHKNLREAILCVLDDSPGMTTKQIVDASGLDRRRVADALKSMHGRGDIYVTAWIPGVSGRRPSAVWKEGDGNDAISAERRAVTVLGTLDSLRQFCGRSRLGPFGTAAWNVMQGAR